MDTTGRCGNPCNWGFTVVVVVVELALVGGLLEFADEDEEADVAAVETVVIVFDVDGVDPEDVFTTIGLCI
jgi:hypothetical protein